MYEILFLCRTRIDNLFERVMYYIHLHLTRGSIYYWWVQEEHIRRLHEYMSLRLVYPIIRCTIWKVRDGSLCYIFTSTGVCLFAGDVWRAIRLRLNQSVTYCRLPGARLNRIVLLPIECVLIVHVWNILHNLLYIGIDMKVEVLLKFSIHV